MPVEPSRLRSPLAVTEPLDGLVVVERAGSLAGGYCGKLFADHGAEVVLIGETALPSSQDRYVNPAKARRRGADAQLLARADVLIESCAEGPLQPMTIDRSDVVRVQLSPFGASGPYAGWASSDVVDYAIGGHAYLYGDPAREPLAGPPNQPRYASGLLGFIGAMAALLGRRRTGAGQIVEVAHVEAMAALHQFTLLRYTMGEDVLCRMGNRFTGQGQPNSIYPCTDGWVCVSAPAPDQVERLLSVAELDHLLDRPDITSPMDFQVLPHVLDDALVPWLAERRMDDIVELLQAIRVPAAPVATMKSLLADPHLAERDYWRPADDGAVRVPGPPFRLGEATGPGSDRPLDGLRVLDLTRVWAGPLAARTLAELGADVVWIEAPWSRGPRQLPESLVEVTKYFPGNDQGDTPWNRNGHLIKFSLGKRSLALDMAVDGGVATFERLVPWADVVIENFSSRVMPQFGLDEHRLHELNSDLIYVTMPGYGRSGPAEHWLAFGSSVDSHAGLSSLVGYADQRPWKGGVAWPDPVAGLHATSALLIGLWDGRGRTIEVPQFEATVAVVGDQLLAAQDGLVLDGPSNRVEAAAPQGIYRCAGNDRWAAITVADDARWSALCEVIGIDELQALTLAERSARHDEIDLQIAAWTGERDQRAVAEALQAVGIAAGPVLDAPGMLADPHFGERRLFGELDQPDVGPFTTARIPIHLSATPARMAEAAPRLGEHNAEVLAEIGGLTRAEIDALAEAGVIATEPPA